MLTSSLERKVLGGLGLASIIIAGVTLTYHLGTEHLVATNGKVAQSYALLNSLGDLARNLQTLRMATRGYVVSGDADIENMRDAADGMVGRALGSLRLEAGDVHRRQHVLEIERMAKIRLVESHRLIELRKSSGGFVAALVAAVQYRQDVEDPLRKSIEHLERRTRLELDRREQLAQASHVIMFAILLVSAVVELAFAVAAAGVIRRDIAERKRAAAAVEASERTLRSFYDSGVTMMGIVELHESDIVHISDNRATAEFFGQDAAAMTGRTASQLGMPAEAIRMWVEKYEESFRRGGPVQFEYQHPMPDGSCNWLSTVVCPIERWTPSSRTRFSYVALDVTARKLAEETLQKQSADLEQARQAADAANLAKSNFLANMSHEIRTPMTAVLGYSDLLAEPGRSDEERGQWVGVIRRNARHLLDLINDILDLSKIEAGKMTLECVACDPAQVIGDVIELMRPRATEKRIALRLENDSPLPRCISGDPLRLRQVLTNLIGNAIKFTEAGEVTVHVSCDAPSSTLHVEVRDTGIGMTAEQLSRLFRPFTQADETMTRRFGGTGLGLTITQRLLEVMGGTLVVQSEPGIGSFFRMTLPVLSISESEPAPQSNPLSATPRQLPGRILLAEDAPDMQRLTSFLLRRSGAEVTVVSTGRQAVDAVERASAEQANFDLVLMDMQMPELDGYAATAELRRKGHYLPIIAVTAHAMTGDRARFLAAGCTDYLTKPIDANHLLQRCASYLTRTRDPDAAAKVA
jgi:PAS domain S-box-containing protein